jgi:predicted enzyme related to lactoylglutathione lyase
MELTLLVIRSEIPEKLAEFYEHFGINFEHHRHGNGPYHYSGHIGPTLLEIYPFAKSQDRPDLNLRLGLAIDNFDAVVETLDAITPLLQPPKLTEWGVMAVVADPEGRKIELYKK